MRVDMAGACFHWPQPLLPPTTTAAVFSSLSRTLLGTRSNKRVLSRGISASLDSFFTDDEYVNRLTNSRLTDNCFSAPEWHTDLSVEKRASSVELPVSLRLIKRKKRSLMQEVGESACCSVNKAFSSMVFIIEELQTYAMRDLLLAGNLNRVQGDMHASFVWLFQRIFSSTPSLMLSLMLLLANFTVYHTAAVAAAAPPPSPPTVTVEAQHHITKTLSIGGGDGGGKQKPVAGATDDTSFSYRSNTNTISTSTPSAPAAVTDQDEVSLWKVIEEDAMKMQAVLRGEALMDPETVRSLVSPVTAVMEAEDDSVYLKTELMYFQAVSQDPSNALLLSNFAQFLFIVLHDLDRAEYYFKLAVETEERDAESLARYASFLWVARKNMGAAEETYLEAIAADPANSYHSAKLCQLFVEHGGRDHLLPNLTIVSV